MCDMLQDSQELSEYLGISGGVWKVSDVPYRDVVAIMQKMEINEMVARVLAIREIPIEDIRDFLYPTLKLLMPDPFHFLDMDKAVDRIVSAVVSGESIVVFGDYDVDGATSSAMLKKYFCSIGVETKIYIPHRIEEGYGPNTSALVSLKNEGYGLCITVDCGTSAHIPILAAKSEGLDVIVLDHHLGGTTLPEAVAVVNPNRLDETSSYTYLSGVGMSFMLLVALHKTLRASGFFSTRKEPDLMQYLDLVALGTICDVMPMIKLNRAFVKHGLKIMASRSNLGLKVLTDALNICDKPSVYHMGFCIGPHINAGGRIGNSGLGAQLLSSDSEVECNNIVSKLLSLNTERRRIEDIGMEEARAQAESLVAQGNKIIMVVGNWHPGIIGIMAGRLKEMFSLPTIVVSWDSHICKASARSITGIDIGAAVLSAKLENLIPEGGGHKMAAGFSVYPDNMEKVYDFFLQRFADADTRKITYACGILSVAAISNTLCKELMLLEPFGPGNAEPKFILKNVLIRNSSIVGKDHVRCWIENDGSSVRGICFRCIGTDLGLYLMQYKKPISLLGTVGINQWQGNEYVQFIIDDASISNAW
ncbi:single-stranded-DNA-specific exonuclease RecJ [Anaplasma bovis]|uniref:single-stranded-DNA-specific exonuclease RecJ n=1 Tax=Anaplasma bovis TaxID=186733 RepID=UPI003977CF7D